MNAVYTTNLKCESCLETLGPLLDAEQSIKSWEVDLVDTRKLLKVELTSSKQAARVVDILKHEGYSASLLQEQEHRAEPGEGFSLASYKPLLLVVIYVCGATILAESIHGSFEWQRAMSYFMGFFFLGFAFFKFLNISGFADAFSTYDIIAKRSRIYAMLYPWLEVFLGLLFVIRAAPFLTNLATAIVMSIGLVGVVSALREKRTIECACLGTIFNLPMSVVTVIENSVMITMAVTMLVSSQAS